MTENKTEALTRGFAQGVMRRAGERVALQARAHVRRTYWRGFAFGVLVSAAMLGVAALIEGTIR